MCVCVHSLMCVCVCEHEAPISICSRTQCTRMQPPIAAAAAVFRVGLRHIIFKHEVSHVVYGGAGDSRTVAVAAAMRRRKHDASSTSSQHRTDESSRLLFVRTYRAHTPNTTRREQQHPPPNANAGANLPHHHNGGGGGSGWAGWLVKGLFHRCARGKFEMRPLF